MMATGDSAEHVLVEPRYLFSLEVSGENKVDLAREIATGFRDGGSPTMFMTDGPEKGFMCVFISSPQKSLEVAGVLSQCLGDAMHGCELSELA
ncbi:hypothetical protein HN446_01185 [bacterium]|nr:hypothetical protein [bacterium]